MRPGPLSYREKSRSGTKDGRFRKEFSSERLAREKRIDAHAATQMERETEQGGVG